MTEAQRHKQTKPVSWFTLFWKNAGFYAMIGGVAVILATGTSVVNYYKAARMDSRGVVTAAIVVEKDTFGTKELKLRFATFTYELRGETYSVKK